jgi:hypothetical protein
MTVLTREGIASVLGAVEDRLASEIARTGASLDELVEAKAWVDNDEALINAGRHLASGRVGALVQILMRADEEEAPAVAERDR